MIKVQHVDPNYIHQVWDIVEPLLTPVFEKSAIATCYTIDNLKDYIIRGEQTLLVGIDEKGDIQCAACIQWLNYPNARVAYITAIGGKILITKENHQELASWVRAMGGTKIQGSARESVARLWRQKLGYTPRQITMELNV
jgi:hypothetical protein